LASTQVIDSTAEKQLQSLRDFGGNVPMMQNAEIKEEEKY
jgi:hypothetical protein